MIENAFDFIFSNVVWVIPDLVKTKLLKILDTTCSVFDSLTRAGTLLTQQKKPFWESIFSTKEKYFSLFSLVDF